MTVTAPTPLSQAPLVSGEAVELDVRVARLGSRALALLIDVLAQVVLFFTLMIVTLIALSMLGPRFVDDALASTVMRVLAITVLLAYPTLMETFTNGRSLGKLAVGLRVVREDGGPIRLRHAFTRSMVGLAAEWPGLLLLPLTWVVCLLTMVFSPRGKRLGDLAAGTLVIHTRTPVGWGFIPPMPPPLATWSTRLDLTAVDDDLALAARNYLARVPQLREPYRTRVGEELAGEVVRKVTPAPPAGTPAWAFLAAVLAERHRRAALRRAALRRAGSAEVAATLRSATPLSGWRALGPMPADAMPTPGWNPAAPGPERGWDSAGR